MVKVELLARAFLAEIERCGPPSRRIVSVVGLPAVGKSTCLNCLRKEAIPACILDEQDFLNEDDLSRAVEADKKLAFTPGNAGIAEQVDIYVGAEMRRSVQILNLTSPTHWFVVCGGVETTVLTLELLASRGLVNPQPFRDKSYALFAGSRSSVTIALVANSETLAKRLQTRIRATGKDEDRSNFIRLVDEHYLTWLHHVVPEVITIDTNESSPPVVCESVKSILLRLRSR